MYPHHLYVHMCTARWGTEWKNTDLKWDRSHVNFMWRIQGPDSGICLLTLEVCMRTWHQCKQHRWSHASSESATGPEQPVKRHCPCVPICAQAERAGSPCPDSFTRCLEAAAMECPQGACFFSFSHLPATAGSVDCSWDRAGYPEYCCQSSSVLLGKIKS